MCIVLLNLGITWLNLYLDLRSLNPLPLRIHPHPLQIRPRSRPSQIRLWQALGPQPKNKKLESRKNWKLWIGYGFVTWGIVWPGNFSNCLITLSWISKGLVFFIVNLLSGMVLWLMGSYIKGTTLIIKLTITISTVFNYRKRILNHIND